MMVMELAPQRQASTNTRLESGSGTIQLICDPLRLHALMSVLTCVHNALYDLDPKS